MDLKSKPCLYCLFLLCLFSLRLQLCTASDNIKKGQSLTGNQTLTSQNGTFVLGFFTPGKSQKYYIGIWYKRVKKQTVVWVANRETPLPDTSSELQISEDGNLVLTNRSRSSKFPVWSTNSSLISSNSTVAVLLDNGNLVLRDGSDSSVVIWQSFDYPTDTWLPEGKLGVNKITGVVRRLTSWRSLEDPSPGPFSMELETDETVQFRLLWNQTKEYWRSGNWNGQSFSLIPESLALNTPLLSNRYNFSYITNSNESYFTYQIKEQQLTIRFVMDVSSGKIETVVWLESSQQWMPFWTEPNDACDVYSICGAFSACNSKTKHFCSCLNGFEPRYLREWNLNDRSRGCRRQKPLQCDGNSSVNGIKDQFLLISNVQLPSSPFPVSINSADECESFCSKSCSCTAYAFGNSCRIWNGDLLNLHQPSDGADERVIGDLHLRVAGSEPHISIGRTTKVVVVVIGSLLGCVAILAIILMHYYRRSKRSKIDRQSKELSGCLTTYSYNELKAATMNFSEKLGGGSFGSVYKGKLPDSSVIAVKKLEGLRQGEKQFRMEVSTIGMIHHVNLVRLRGFCSKGDDKLLVYDYMPNGSLDNHLFRENSSVLEWKTRFKIAVGIAKGLHYLHEKCRDCIIHCDIKPANVLLDEEFCPKLTDFGMAKLLGHEFSKVLTTMRGTIGYLAPEWISGQPITAKADVYSYGILLLEMIAGTRNTHRSKEGAYVSFPFWAASKLHEGEVIHILDVNLEGKADLDELERACRVGCWCIQENEDSRPSMGQVIQLLEGVQPISVPPIPWYLQHLVEDQ